MKTLALTLLLFIGFDVRARASFEYPRSWWKKITRDSSVPSWEILPQEAGWGEVILSKRTELGVFSNLAATPFDFEGIHYASIEGLWQGMKYPDPNDPDDPRHELEYPHTREEVYLLSDFESKHAGDAANKINEAAGIKWVSYKGKKFDYKDFASGSNTHFNIISQATREKILQNPALAALLEKTKGLKLRPDHKVKSKVPAAYEYHKILMQIRDNE